MQPLKSDDCVHGYKDPNLINVTPLDSEVDDLNHVVVTNIDDNTLADRNRKRSLDDSITEKSIVQDGHSDFVGNFQSANFRCLSTQNETYSSLPSRSVEEAVDHDEKRFRSWKSDDLTTTIETDNITTTDPPPIAQADDNNSINSLTQDKTDHKHEKIDNTKIAFNASSWSVGPRYQILRLLGRGSYGEVAEALDLYQTEGYQKVAIKRIITAFDKEVDAIRLFREIHILRRLRGHTCIIQLLDIIIPQNYDNLSAFQELYLVFECTFL